MADHPLRPATDRRLGRLLPYQLANQGRADPETTPQLLKEPLTPESGDSGATCGISPCFQELFPISGHVTHLLLTSLPLYSGELPPPFSLDLHA